MIRNLLTIAIALAGLFPNASGNTVPVGNLATDTGMQNYRILAEKTQNHNVQTVSNPNESDKPGKNIHAIKYELLGFIIRPASDLNTIAFYVIPDIVDDSECIHQLPRPPDPAN